MKPVICSALLLVLVTTAHCETPGKTVKAIADPDELIASYREMGLPLPPEDAPLVRFEGGTTRAFGDEARKMHQLGFLLKKATDKNSAVLLVGTRTFEIEEPFTVIRPEKAEPDSVEAAWGNPFAANAAFAISIQLRARGFEKVAQALQDASLKLEAGDSYSPFRQAANLPPKTALAVLAWTHWMNEITRPGIDRAPIAKRMKTLIAVEPALNTDAHRSLLRSLETAIVPGKAAPGSAEALIDSLVDLDDEHGGTGRDEPDPRYLKLALLGFEAVPALIEHLDDDRLTRSVKAGFNNFPTWHLRVGQVVSELFQEIAADQLGGDWLKKQKGQGIDRGTAQAWWDRAKPLGEETYLTSHVLPQDDKRGYPYLLALQIIAAKYPARLPEVFTTVREKRPDIQIWYVAKAVTKSALPRERKLELFLHAADDTNLEHRRAAYWELKNLDEKAFVDRLVKTLDALPSTPQEPYWHCREATFANLVMQTNDPRAWQALLAAAKRADVWLRMQYLNPMDYDNTDAGQRRQRLQFLAQFLDDTEVRQAPDRDGVPDMKSKFSGPFAGFVFKRLEVRDYAAMEIAAILKQPEYPHSGSAWSAEQWTAFREQVKTALKKEPGI